MSIAKMRGAELDDVGIGLSQLRPKDSCQNDRVVCMKVGDGIFNILVFEPSCDRC